MNNNEEIRIVWCDDDPIVEKWFNDAIEIDDAEGNYLLQMCRVIKYTRTSNELIEYLNKHKNSIDAVIIDLNLDESNNKVAPSKTASGFRAIHDYHKHNDFSEIPFYLFSGHLLDGFIEEKYDQYELTKKDDYFLQKNKDGEYIRCFDKQNLKNLLLTLVKEVEEIRSRKPEYQIRQEYSEAFEAIAEFSEAIVTEFEDKEFENGAFTKPFIDILTGCNIKKEIGTQLRTFIDGVFRKYSHFTPCWCSMNAIPKLLGGEEKINGKNYNYYQEQDNMPKYLKKAFDFFLEYTNACSHPGNNTNLSLMKAVAIIGLDLIRWAAAFKMKYNNKFKFKIFTTQIKESVDKTGSNSYPLKGYIIVDQYGDKYWLQQDLNIKLKIGDTVKIKKISADNNKEHECEYHVSRQDWELLVDEDLFEEIEVAPEGSTLDTPIEVQGQSNDFIDKIEF